MEVTCGRCSVTDINFHYLQLQQNMPGLDYKGNRNDMNRNQHGTQQIEVNI